MQDLYNFSINGVDKEGKTKNIAIFFLASEDLLMVSHILSKDESYAIKVDNFMIDDDCITFSQFLKDTGELVARIKFIDDRTLHLESMINGVELFDDYVYLDELETFRSPVPMKFFNAA